MLERLFPAHFDNNFRGYNSALWVFYAFTVLTIWRSQHHLFASDGGAQSIATIPLDSYSAAGASTVVS